MIKNEYDVVVIGGGPAGLAAAIESSKNNCSTLLIESEDTLGGILNQCIHAGFGLHYFKEELTGPEYASRFINELKETDVDVLVSTLCTSVSKDKEVTFISKSAGYRTVKAKAIVFATGCRERSAGSIFLNGDRVSGIYTAGAAQKICNIMGYLVGKEIVILGSGDIGLIMARRMMLEGANVKMVIELMEYSSGLKRNIVQCLEDFNIPILYSHTVTGVRGVRRISEIMYAPVDANKQPIMEKEKSIKADTLLLSVGLIPYCEILKKMGAKQCAVTKSVLVDENRMTSIEGVFVCGNTLHVHDLVDNVSNESAIAGMNAAKYAKGEYKHEEVIEVHPDDNLIYALPEMIHKGDKKVDIYFRVKKVIKKAKLKVKMNEEVVFSKSYLVLSPGEMEKITVSCNFTSDIYINVEGE